MTSLILIMVGLSIILVVLVLFYVNAGKTSKQKIDEADEVWSFEKIRSIITRKNSSKAQLYEAIELLIRDYSRVNHERPISAYVSIVEALCVHPNTDSKLILRLEKELRMANIEQEDKIDQALKRGLEARD